MNHRRLALAALAVLATVGTGYLFLRSASVAPTAQPAARPTIVLPSPRQEAPPTQTEPARLVYSVKLEQQIALGGDPLVDDVLEARLEWLPLPGAPLVEVRLATSSLVGVGHELPTRDDLERPLLLQYDAGGALEGLRFAPRTGEPARLLLTALLTGMQFSAGAGDRYQVGEVDGTGRYAASYVRTGPRTFTREKSGYSQLHESDGRIRIEGTTSFLLTADARIEALRSEETTRTRSAAFGAVEGRRLLEVRLLERATPDAGELAEALARAARYEPAQLVVAEGDDEDQLASDMDAERAAGATLDGLRDAFAETEGQPRGGENGERRADLIEIAGALFRHQPGEAAAAGEQLGGAGVTDAEANFLAGGLASADTEAAAHALAGALTSRDASVEAQRQTAASLGMVSTADAATVSALQEAGRSDDPTLRGMSRLALGSQARHLDGASGLDPVADLLIEYERADDLATRAMYLAAFGNSADLRTLPHLRSALGVAELAPTAAFALRFMGAPEADSLLHAATMDSAPTVRIAAYRAAWYRSVNLWLPWLQAALARETHPQAVEAIQAALARAEESA